MASGVPDRRCEVADTAEIAQHGVTAGSDVSGTTPLACGEIPVPAIGPGFVAATLTGVTLNGTRQEPSVDLRFSQHHGRMGVVEVATIVGSLCVPQSVTYIGAGSASA